MNMNGFSLFFSWLDSDILYILLIIIINNQFYILYSVIVIISVTLIYYSGKADKIFFLKCRSSFSSDLSAAKFLFPTMPSAYCLCTVA